MRTLLIAGLGAALASSAADAQHTVQRGPDATYDVPGPVTPPLPPVHGQRWETQGGRWVGGLRAPGGSGAYRAPYVGYALPRYWAQPGFAISSWSAYGLARPAPGYRWYRYYDDAVLVDARGSVHDHVGGVDWDGDGAAYAYDDAPVAPDYSEEYYDRAQRAQREDGLGGAVAGAVGGGILGSAIAGRGDRLEGALIGAGVGAIAGYAIDQAEDRGRRAPPPAHGARYPAPDYHGQGGHWVSPDGRTIVTTGGYGTSHGGATTTVVVQNAPVVTTTTTEYHDDHVTYSRPAPRAVHRRVYRPSKMIRR